jgi:hypothetical protein
MIAFDPLPQKIGSEWYLVATYPSGQKEPVTGFHSEEEALNWLGSDSCQAWLKARGYAE